jgi:hypothetical protein
MLMLMVKGRLARSMLRKDASRCSCVCVCRHHGTALSGYFKDFSQSKQFHENCEEVCIIKQ